MVQIFNKSAQKGQISVEEWAKLRSYVLRQCFLSLQISEMTKLSLTYNEHTLQYLGVPKKGQITKSFCGTSIKSFLNKKFP